MNAIEQLIGNGEYVLALSNVNRLLQNDEYNIEYLTFKARLYPC